MTCPGAHSALIRSGYLHPHAKSPADESLVNSIKSAPTNHEVLPYIALFDEVTLLMRDRDRLFEGTDQITDGVFLEGSHSNALSRWTLTGLMTKGVFAADQFKLEDNPSARLFKTNNIGSFFRTQDLRDMELFKDLIYAKLGDDLKGITDPFECITALAEDPYQLYRWQQILKGIDKRPASKRLTSRKFELYFRHLLWSVRDELDCLRDLFEYSSDKEAVAILAGQQSPPKRGTSEIPANPDPNDSLLATVRVFIEETINLPWPASIDDAIQIRGRKEIRSLRKQLQRWSEAVKEGDGPAQEEIRQGISKASNAVRTAGRCLTIAGWTTYASLPVTTIEALAGLPPIGGFTLATVGVAAQATGDAISWRNRWMAWVPGHHTG